jgi:AraC-like DNA-binding protein
MPDHPLPPVAGAPGAYVEHAPPPALRPFVACLWTHGGSAPGAGAHHVLPDGCVDVMLTVGPDGPDGPDGAAARVVGTMTRAFLAPASAGTRYVAARLRPGAARRLLGVPASELTDRAVPLSDVWRAESPVLLDGAMDADAALARLAALLARRAERASVPPAAVREAVRLLDASGGTRRVDDLAAALGLTRQALARAFAEHVGVSPKTYARVARMWRAIAHVDEARRVGWSPVAHALGFHDQSHLTSELHALTGRTPGEWARAAPAG